MSKLQSVCLPIQETNYAILLIHENRDGEREDCPVYSGMVEGDINALACDFCESWTHMECDVSMTLNRCNVHTANNDLPFICPVCIVVLENKLSSNKLNQELSLNHPPTDKN